VKSNKPKCKISVPFIVSCGANFLLKIMIFRKCALIHERTDNFVLKSAWSVVCYNCAMSSLSNLTWLFLLSFVGGQCDVILSTFDVVLSQLENVLNCFDVLDNHIKDGKINKLNIKYNEITLYAMPKCEITEEMLEEVAPLVSKGNGNMRHVNDTYCCSVCLEDFGEEQMHRKLPCNHAFHAHCIDNWLLYKSLSCPMCRESVLHTSTTTPSAL
jgi:hypothetical protein